MAREGAYRSLTFCMGIWNLVTSVALFISLQQLPDDSLHVTRHLSVYCLFTGVLGIVGIVGVKQRNASLINIFATYLLVDIAISTVVRLLALMALPALSPWLCSDGFTQSWLQPSRSSQNALVSANARLTLVDMDAQCDSVIGLLQIVMAGLVLANAVLQVALAVRVRRFGAELEREEIAGESMEANARSWKSDEKIDLLNDELQD